MMNKNIIKTGWVIMPPPFHEKVKNLLKKPLINFMYFCFLVLCLFSLSIGLILNIDWLKSLTTSFLWLQLVFFNFVCIRWLYDGYKGHYIRKLEYIEAEE